MAIVCELHLQFELFLFGAWTETPLLVVARQPNSIPIGIKVSETQDSDGSKSRSFQVLSQ